MKFSQTQSLLAVTAAAVLVAAWGAESKDARAVSQNKEAVAAVGDLEVKGDELHEAASAQLEAVEMEKLQCQASADKRSHDVLAFHLERLVRDRLAMQGAQAASLDKDAFLAKELEARRAKVSSAEVDNIIAGNPQLSRVPREQIVPQVETYLAENALYSDLEKQFSVERSLEPYRVEIDGSEGNAKGGENAVVEIVEFSDFQCPYCKQVNPVLNDVVKKYDGKVKLVFRQFPLTSIHPEAFKAAEASLCAADQGKFWEMHDLLFEEQRQLGLAELKQKGKRLGLDESSFNQCLDSDQYEGQVQADLKAGTMVGVASSGTPAVFINGRPYEGPRDVRSMSEIIDQELAASER